MIRTPLRLLLVEDSEKYQRQVRTVICDLKEEESIDLLVETTSSKAIGLLTTIDNSRLVAIIDQCLADSELGDVVAKRCLDNNIPYCRWSGEPERRLFHEGALQCIDKPCADKTLRRAVRLLLAERLASKKVHRSFWAWLRQFLPY